MKLIVDIREKDIEALKNKVMTIEGMENTLEGRIICAIVHAALYTTLDKIRAEIEQERVHDDWDFGQEIYYNNAIDDVLQIIDKYKTKSEDAE